MNAKLLRKIAGQGLLTFVGGCWGSNGEPKTPLTSVLDPPVFDVGARDDIMFPAGATRLSNGNIAVADFHAATILIFDSIGKLIRTGGRKGSGPGEFETPNWLGRCSEDSLFVSDAIKARMTVLDSSGKMSRTYSLAEIQPGLIVCSQSGVFAYLGPPKQNVSQLQDPKSEPATVNGDLMVGDKTGSLTGSRTDVVLGRWAPLGEATRIALAGDRIYVATGSTPSVDIYSTKGRKVGAFDTKIRARPATQRHMDAYIDGIVASFADKRTKEVNRQYFSRFPLPKSLPTYNSIFADVQGNIWVSRSFPGDSVTELRMFDRNGAAIADVLVPMFVKVYEIGDDYLLGSYDDGEGRPHVAMFRLKPQI